MQLSGTSKRYGQVEALEPLDLVVPAGQVVCVVGHNGSGKSTLLRLVAGLVEPTAGSVLVFGRPPADRQSRQRVSYIPDTPVLYEDLSVWEHLQYVNRLHGGRGDDPRLDELVGRLGLDERRDHLPSQFSRGLRQKAALAVALARPFRLLLIDEPFVGLDAGGRTSLVELLDQARAGGATVVVATHDPQALGSVDRWLVLADGRVEHDDAIPPA